MKIMVLNSVVLYSGTPYLPLTFLTSTVILVVVLVLFVSLKRNRNHSNYGRDSWLCLPNEQVIAPAAPVSSTKSHEVTPSGGVITVSVPDKGSPRNSKRNRSKKSKKSRASANSQVVSHKNKPPDIQKKSRNPLEGYWDLPFTSAELYSILFPYRLSLMERIGCGYPVASDLNPSIMIQQKRSAEDPNSKQCLRCGRSFRVTEDERYVSEDEQCCYHTSKRTGHNGRYACCDGSDDDRGCIQSRYHICGQPPPHSTQGFVRTRRRNSIEYPNGNSIYAIDCEMCYTIRGLQVTKVSVVGPNGCTVYDSYVKPDMPILDYNTAFSGVTAKHLQGVSTTLADVQAVLLRLFSADTILIGHGLENDLRALEILHDTVIDTAVVFPHWNGLPYRRSLRSLVRSYLKRDIQSETHDSAEDARAAMELMLWKSLRDRTSLRLPHRTPSTSSSSTS